MTIKTLTLGSLLALAVAGCGDSSTTTVTPAPSTPAPAAPAGDADALKASAEKLLADAGTYVKDHKWEMADKAVASLEDMKPKLPAEYGPRIDQLKTGLAAAKTAAGVK